MPQAMLFVRGENHGISHNPLESTTAHDMDLAVQAFSHLLTQLAAERSSWAEYWQIETPTLQQLCRRCPDYKLRLTFVDASIYTVSLADEFDKFPGLAPLRDPAATGACIIEGEGWTVEWPEHDIQIGADTLWLDAKAQNSVDENTRIFTQWRSHNALTLPQAAKALGMTVRTMSAYGTGARPVPRYVAGLQRLGSRTSQALEPGWH